MAPTDAANDVVVVVVVPLIFRTMLRHPHAKLSDATMCSILDESRGLDPRMDQVPADATPLLGARGGSQGHGISSVDARHGCHNGYRDAWQRRDARHVTEECRDTPDSRWSRKKGHVHRLRSR